MNQEAVRNAGRIQAAREEIVERMSRLLPEDGRIDVLSDLLLIRSSVPSEPVQSIYQPAFCFVAQGRKRASVGGEVFLYDPFHYLIYTVDLPVAFEIEAPSKERPYLGMSLNLDSALVASVIVESGIRIKKGDASVKAMNVSVIDADLLDAVARLVRIAETPAEAGSESPGLTNDPAAPSAPAEAESDGSAADSPPEGVPVAEEAQPEPTQSAPAPVATAG